MNLYELDTASLEYCKLDSTDTEERTRKKTSFLRSYNTAYERIMREKIRPWIIEAVTLGTDKSFDLTSDLSKTCVKIQRITKYEDYEEDAGYFESSKYEFYEKDGIGNIVVPVADAGDTVYVNYQYMPALLTHKEMLFNISGAESTKTIPIDEVITANMVDKLVGSKISVYDSSGGVYQTLTITSVTIGAAGAASITVSETISPSVADGDIIYTNENTEYRVTSEYNTPQFDSFRHTALCYYAAYEHYLTKDKHDRAISYLNLFDNVLGKIKRNYGVKQELKNAYSTEI